MGEPETPPGGLGPARLQVIAREYSFTLSRPEVPAGPVIVEFDNAGEDSHNLHLDPGSAEPEAGAFPATAAGGRMQQRLTLRAGAYTLFCSLPTHRALGMEATLRVR